MSRMCELLKYERGTFFVVNPHPEDKFSIDFRVEQKEGREGETSM